MERRNLFKGALAAATAAFAVARGGRTAQAATPNVSKVAYHLSDFDKVTFVLGNIENHLKGMGGPDKVAIVLVVHGPALKAFHRAGVTRDVAFAVSGFVKAGVGFFACANTMLGQHVTLADLVPGFASAERGGVVLLAELQAQGYAYLRP